MNKTKSAIVSGTFYPDDKNALTEVIKTFNTHTKKEYNITSRAIIVPHAGYIYSGLLACEGFHYLDKNVKNIFIIAPSHHLFLTKPALLDYNEYETPLGKININQEIYNTLISELGCEYNNEAYEKEHSVEVQIPFIQYFYKNVNIIPILVSYGLTNDVKEIIERFYGDKNNAFVISTDLSHFHEEKEAENIDTLTATMIELIGTDKFNHQQACGSAGICGLVNFARENKYSLIRLGMMNSSAITQNPEKVVGYGAWILYEDITAEFIKKYYTSEVIDVCKKSITAKLKQQKTEIGNDLPTVFKEFGAAFVTLQKDNKLRGCIGSIIPHQPLIVDLAQHAYDAAFNDNRFSPLTLEEYEDTSISVSLLSPPTQIEFENEEDLMNKIKPFKDGIIIKDDNKQAVFLPSVWEQLPDKRVFMTHLKMKAGMEPNHFSETFEAFKFSAVYIKED